MKIRILLCDTFPGLLPDYIPSYESMFIRLFDAVTDEAEYEVYPTYQGVVPEISSEDGFYLITGSNSGAYEDKEWINILKEWIRRAYAEQVKLIGICFGHQVIAQALGGKVEPAPQGWGTGIRVSEMLDEKGFSYFPDKRMRLLYNHHDQVMCLPEGAVRVATSSFCPNESFRIGSRVLTFQGHPEYIPEYARHLIVNHAMLEPSEVKLQALHSIDTLSHQGLVVAKWIVDFAG